MKFIFFVLTSASIYDRILPLIEEKRGKGEIIIVATTNHIEQFFKDYTDFKVIRTKIHPDLITTRTKSKIFTNIIRSKVEYNKLFRNIKGTEIYFCNRSWALVIFSYIKKLSKNNKVIYFGTESEKSKVNFPIDNHIFRVFIMRGIAKWFMGVNTIIKNNMGVPFWSLNEKDFFKNITLMKNYSSDKKLLEKYMKKLDFLQEKEILITIEDSIAAGTIEKSEFINKMDQVMDILDRIYPDKYMIKPHPRLDRLYGKMSNCTEIIPPYIPSEFIMNHDWKTVIGINSWSLIQASRITNARVISLIDPVEFTNENIKKMFRDWLAKESNNKINFLQQVIELEQILKKK